MKLKMEPVTIIILGILLSFGFGKITNKAVCYTDTKQEDGTSIIQPVYCEDLDL